MTEPQIDYKEVFRTLPTPILLITPELSIIDMNQAYLRISGKSREELVGRNVFDAFPDNPAEPSSTSTARLGTSLHHVLDTGERDVMPIQRYDVEVPGSPGTFEERYWCPENVPMRGPDGQVAVIIHAVEEVSALIRMFVEAEAANA